MSFVSIFFFRSSFWCLLSLVCLLYFFRLEVAPEDKSRFWGGGKLFYKNLDHEQKSSDLQTKIPVLESWVRLEISYVHALLHSDRSATESSVQMLFWVLQKRGNQWLRMERVQARAVIGLYHRQGSEMTLCLGIRMNFQTHPSEWFPIGFKTSAS